MICVGKTVASVWKLTSLAVRQFGRSSQRMDINNVVIIGSGLMGSGIAQNGCRVSLVDVSDEILSKSRKNMEVSLGRVAKKKFASDKQEGEKYTKEIMQRITMTTSLANAAKNADLCIEAIVENLDSKVNLFQTLEKEAPSEALLVTNTSSLPLSEICASLKNKERFAGLHFFNPVPMMKLVEIVRALPTSNQTIDALAKYVERLKKTAVMCRDTPGFIVNRLLVPAGMEAIRLAERGDASKEDIDIAMKLGAGHPMGPFELFDYIGLDTCKFIIDGWHKRFPENPIFSPSPMLDKLVEQGKLGRKTGEGFFKYK
ncbi:l 3 hydroxyacyl coenzyme a dehydrogenase, short [Trichuris trichiura]|uniref:3-hydroxyacyl-CoA dehydrogenase n=1 Tax=Trichuris trichiura TaxID=36087 RepID=A0A077Z595_TRITR|nr:l 3 hydroxyacyl coenzyme a dehydrogenase, short [Trichuris trichiura]